MYKIIALFIVLGFSTATTLAQSVQPKVQSAGMVMSEEETVVSNALEIRARNLEEKTGIKFGKGWRPQVSIEWSLGRNIDGEYRAKERTIYFVRRMASELTVNYKTPLRLLPPDVLAENERFSELADHELGHELADIVSRRVGAGPFFTPEHYDTLPLAKQWGVNIVSEGIGMYFQRLLHPREDVRSPLTLPSSREDMRNYSFDVIAFQGGLWLVNDIIAKHGERGIAWLVTHRLEAGENMRASAITYRERALKELALRKNK